MAYKDETPATIKYRHKIYFFLLYFKWSRPISKTMVLSKTQPQKKMHNLIYINILQQITNPNPIAIIPKQPKHITPKKFLIVILVIWRSYRA